VKVAGDICDYNKKFGSEKLFISILKDFFDSGLDII
jgi:hypothetical protein